MSEVTFVEAASNVPSLVVFDDVPFVMEHTCNCAVL